MDNELALIGPTRILVEAQRQDARLVTQCSICYNVLKRTARFLHDNPEQRERIGLFIEEEDVEDASLGEVQVLHLLELLRDELGFGALSERVTAKLGLKTAPYYGCLLLRPQKEIALDDPDEPTILHGMLASLGCTAVDFPAKTECCGSYLTVNASDAAQELSYSILSSAQDAGAEMLVTSCPLCQFNLDYRQEEMAKEHTGFRPLPVLYFATLLGIALGLDSTDYGLEEHYVDPRPLLERKGLIAAT
jgi:heterodisulfide reductase subunit B